MSNIGTRLLCIIMVKYPNKTRSNHTMLHWMVDSILILTRLISYKLVFIVLIFLMYRSISFRGEAENQD